MKTSIEEVEVGEQFEVDGNVWMKLAEDDAMLVRSSDAVEIIINHKRVTH